MPGFFHDDGLDDLPPQQILLADDAGLLHRGVEAEDDLDLPGIDVESARDDHPLLPTGEEDVTVPSIRPEVARMKPAVPDHLGGCLLVLVITLHDVFAPEDQFADGLRGSSRPSSSTIFAATPGMGIPMEPGFWGMSRRLKEEAGDASVRP